MNFKSHKLHPTNFKCSSHGIQIFLIVCFLTKFLILHYFFFSFQASCFWLPKLQSLLTTSSLFMFGKPKSNLHALATRYSVLHLNYFLLTGLRLDINNMTWLLIEHVRHFCMSYTPILCNKAHVGLRLRLEGTNESTIQNKHRAFELVDPICAKWETMMELKIINSNLYVITIVSEMRNFQCGRFFGISSLQHSNQTS